MREMNMITEPIQTRRALLTWQRPLEQNGPPRRRFAVAELVKCGEGLGFSYKNDSEFALASEAGFEGYPGLALGGKHESSTATDVLKRRLPPRNRPDFKEFMERFGLWPEAHFSILSLLAYTGARLSSDGFGISETFDGFDRPFRYIFDIAGYRHYSEGLLGLAEKEPVLFRHEPTNPDDPHAVEVIRQNGARVGYVNRMQTGPVLRWLTHGKIDACVFRLNGRSVYPRLFIMADIVPNCRRTPV